MTNHHNITCTICNLKRRTRGTVFIKGKAYCGICKKKVRSPMQIPNSNAKISLQEALDRTYEIKGRLTKQNQIVAYNSFPSVLIGHKVKLILHSSDEINSRRRGLIKE